MNTKGIILAGGKGTRLHPATLAMNKHMIPILNKPMILYPLETLTKAFGIKDVMIISGGNHIGSFADLLGDGSEHGASLTYRVQREAGGIAQALLLAEDFVAGSRCVVVLGDNIFDNTAVFDDAAGIRPENNACIFTKDVGYAEASRFGVVRFDEESKVRISAIVEKPEIPPSPYAVTGLYSYPPDVFEKVRTLSFSSRGELEITDLNNLYVGEGRMTNNSVSGFWSDAGTPESLARTTAWALSDLLAKQGV